MLLVRMVLMLHCGWREILVYTLVSHLCRKPNPECLMTEERKFAILFAATLLSARKLSQLESDRPSPVKFCAVDRAIDQAVFILKRIDERWPTSA